VPPSPTLTAAASARPASLPGATSEVEIRFIAESPLRTRVQLEHRNLDRHGPGWESMRDAVGHPNGWPGGLELFAQHLSG